MNIYLFFLFFNSFFIDNNAPQTMVISGSYQGKNLYIQNPFTANMKDFCTDEVYLNEVKIMDNIKSSAYEIDLSNLPVNTPVNIRIIHKEDCKPKVLNAQVIRSGLVFSFANFMIDEKELLWSTKGEKPGDKIYVEQFLYNNWVTLREIPAKGTSSSNSYSLESNHHSGVNKYRIKHIEKESNTVHYSKVVDYVSANPEVTFFPKRVSNKIYLSRVVDYEIVDGSGNILAKGKGKEIPCERLEEGVYYLNIDNKTEKFLKK